MSCIRKGLTHTRANSHLVDITSVTPHPRPKEKKKTKKDGRGSK